MSMRKGFLASVAALAASAGVALGQGGAESWPTWSGNSVLGTQYSGPGPGAMPAPDGGSGVAPGLPPATEMPRYGPSYPPGNGGGPGCYPGGYDPSLPPGASDPRSVGSPAPKQVHQTAGGPDRCYFELDYLIYAIRHEPIAAPLLTVTQNVNSGGIIGTEGTTVAVGDKNLDFGLASGLRLTTGLWDCDHRCAYEISAFLMEQKAFDNTYSNAINQRTLLARPIFEVTNPVVGAPGNPNALIVAVPGVNAGSVRIYANDRLGGVETNALRSWLNYDTIKVNGMVGFRFLNLDEKLEVFSRTDLPVAAVPGINDLATIEVADSFTTHNLNYLGQVGVQAEFRRGRVFADVYGKIGAGTVHEIIAASGETRLTPQFGNPPQIFNSGLLVLEPNRGQRDRWEFAYVPELNLKFGYQCTQRISGYLGYNILYLSSVVRPGDQVDPVVNPTLLPVAGSPPFSPLSPFGPPRPMTLFKTSDYWVQGIQLGVTVRY